MTQNKRHQINLFEDLPGEIVRSREEIGPGAVVQRGFALGMDSALRAAIEQVTTRAPFRHMVTPGGFRMSVAMTNCGQLGWVTDRTGYRYSPTDPESGLNWQTIPDVFQKLAVSAAKEAGFVPFIPDACLINRYAPGTRLSLHQDKDESDFDQPIVSVSLGLPATFLFGGLERTDKTARVRLEHGDVVIWGGPSRLRYHGVLALKHGQHDFAGAHRINLTFRKAG